MTWIEKFSDPEKVRGYSIKPDKQKERKGKKYFDIPIPKKTQQSLKLEKDELLHIMIRNPKGQNSYFKKETTSRTKGLKFYLPRSVVEELNVSEDDVLDVFISRY